MPTGPGWRVEGWSKWHRRLAGWEPVHKGRERVEGADKLAFLGISKNSTPLNDIIAALSTSILYTIGAYSFATLIFSGPLLPHVLQGFNLILISNIVGCLFGARFSSYPILAVLTQASALTLYALITTTLISNKTLLASEVDPVSTVYVAMILLTIMNGIFLWALGKFKMGNLVRFIPFPVIAAFLAASGWYLIEVSLKLIIGKPFEFTWMQNAQMVLQLFLCLSMVVGIIVLQKWFSRSLVEPCFFVASLLFFYFLLFMTDTPISNLKTSGWYIDIVKIAGSSNPLKMISLSNIQWLAFLDWDLLGNTLAVLFITPIFFLLTFSGIETESQHEFNYDDELKYIGISNVILSVLGGGAIVGAALSGTTRNRQLGAKSRWVGVYIAVFFAIALAFGAPVLKIIPLFIVASLPLLTGISLLSTWLFKTKIRLSTMDYLLLWFIFSIIVFYNFLIGILVGIMASLILFDYRYSRISMIRNDLTGLQIHSNSERGIAAESLLRSLRPGIEIIILQGYLFFGNMNTLIEKLIDRIESLTKSKLFFIVLDFRNVQGIDSSSMESFFRLYNHAKAQEVRLVFTHLATEIFRNIQYALKLTRKDDYCLNFTTLDYGLEWCEDWLLKQKSLNWRTYFAGQLYLIFPDEKELNIFINYLEHLTAHEGQVIFSEDALLNQIYFLETGTLDMIHTDVKGNTLRVKTIHPGVFVGETGLYLGMKQSFSCVAKTTCTLYSLSFENLIKLEKEKPNLAIQFHRFMVCQSLNRLTHTHKTILALV